MKFSLFAHMERINDQQSHSQLYEEFVDLCLLAEAGGMTTVWTGEHHGMDFTIAPNPFILLADLSRATNHIRLGTGTIVAPFWHPIKLAGEAAMFDVVSGGRLELGLARGAYAYEYERLVPGMDAWQAGLRLRESVPAIKGLWEGDYAHDGEFYQFPATTASPKPVQEGGPPVWVAARDPNTHEFALEQGCHVQVTPLWQGVEEIEHLMQNFVQAKATTNASHNPKIMLLQHCYVGANESEVEDAIMDINRFYCYFGSWFKNERVVKQGLLETLTSDEMQSMQMYSPEVIANNMPIGTSAQVTERLKHYEQLGYDEFSFWIDSSMSFAKKKASLQRFMDEVMPVFA